MVSTRRNRVKETNEVNQPVKAKAKKRKLNSEGKAAVCEANVELFSEDTPDVPVVDPKRKLFKSSSANGSKQSPVDFSELPSSQQKRLLRQAKTMMQSGDEGDEEDEDEDELEDGSTHFMFACYEDS